MLEDPSFEYDRRLAAGRSPRGFAVLCDVRQWRTRSTRGAHGALAWLNPRALAGAVAMNVVADYFGSGVSVVLRKVVVLAAGLGVVAVAGLGVAAYLDSPGGVTAAAPADPTAPVVAAVGRVAASNRALARDYCTLTARLADGWDETSAVDRFRARAAAAGGPDTLILAHSLAGFRNDPLLARRVETSAC